MERLDELRIEALRAAQAFAGDASTGEIVSRAEAFFKFLTSSISSNGLTEQGSAAPEKSCEVPA